MLDSLPRRERQLFDALLAIGEGGAEQIRAAMIDPPGNSAVRAMLSRLEAKGFVVRRTQEHRHLYRPTLAPSEARDDVLRQMVRTFFNGSPVGAATALLGISEQVREDELKELEEAIRRARATK
jgi:predicted transcriptional regulator